MTVMLIRKLAKDMAASYWDDDHSERFRKFWPDVKQFVGRNWPNFVEVARQTLVGMLAMPATPSWQKEEIYDALEEDARRSQRRDAMSSQVGKGKLSLNPNHPGKMETAIFYKQ